MPFLWQAQDVFRQGMETRRRQVGKRKRVIYVAAGILVAAATGGILWGLAGGSPAAGVETVSHEEIREAYGLLRESLNFQTIRYQDYIAERELQYGRESGSWEPEEGEKETGYDGTASAQH